MRAPDTSPVEEEKQGYGSNTLDQNIRAYGMVKLVYPKKRLVRVLIAR